MQYILNEEEYQIFKDSKLTELKAAAVSVARDELLKIANYTCVHNREGHHGGYCDGCPCSPIANGHEYRVWDLICGQTKYYSK
jgi:hypothetical protein